MKILVVEDEPGIVRFLKQGLEEEGFEVEVAEDGDLGLEMAMNGTYDLLLLDWMLPGTSGVKICHRFRKKDPQTPIILLTAKDTVQDTILGLQTGANDYIKKPFHFDELLERIRVQLRDKSIVKDSFTLGKVTLNNSAHKVYVNDEEVYLTQKEFGLLKYLLQNKGQVCTRTKILEDVWDIHFEYNSGVIDVYINALRKKLDLKGKDNFIETIRGIGYMAREADEA